MNAVSSSDSGSAEPHRLLARAVDALSMLLSGQEPVECIPQALRMLGEAVGADRIYVFENHQDAATNEPLISQRYEWCADSVMPFIENAALQNLRYHPSLTRWYETLRIGGSIKGAVRGFPDSERALLEPQDIRSMLVLPIVVDGGFWGFIGFDDCKAEREWSSAEEDILRAAAVGVGAAYVRQRSERRQRLASVVFDASRDAILVADKRGRLLAANRGFSRLTGYTESELRGRTPWVLWAEQRTRPRLKEVSSALLAESAWKGEFLARRKDGEQRVAFLKIRAVRDGTGQLTHLIGVATDLTLQKEAERRAERLAFYDPVTDLPNRVLFAQRAELALAMAARRDKQVAIVLLDLDRFREVNDSLGHREGDALLLQVAVRLRAVVRAEDTLCRLGGDEFALLLPESDQDGALKLADKVLHVFREPFQLAGHRLILTGSIGIALSPTDGSDFAELLKNADTALHRAKLEGKHTRVFYDRAMNEATFGRLVLEAELREAVRSGQLRVHYQPKLAMRNRVVVGAEALIRWQHPTRGLLSPGEFIPVAEPTDLIVALGDWVMSEVCRQLAAWRSAATPPVTVAVNLAARHFRHPGLADRVNGILQAYGLPARLLEVELTESTLLDQSGSTLVNLLELRDLGVRVALDDFGTGYSSLSYLKRLPLNSLKIDRSFVRDLVTDPDDRKLVGTVIALGRHLDLEVIAEGVETDEQRQILLQEGCEVGQGYLFGRPQPAGDFAASWLSPLKSKT